jgi:hypothetical protein
MAVSAVGNSLSGSLNNNIIAAHVDLISLQRARRRAGNVFAIQVVLPVVAGTPDKVQLWIVLNRAIQMGTGCRKGFVFPILG